jgi:hypothetical protein
VPETGFQVPFAFPSGRIVEALLRVKQLPSQGW